MKAFMNFVICLMSLCASSAFCAEIENLLTLQGDKYVQARNELLKNNSEIPDIKTDDPRMIMLLNILREHKMHPGVLEKLPEVIKRGYGLYEENINQFGPPCGYTIIKGAVSGFMWRGIEQKEYITYESPTGGISDEEQIRHIQTDEEVTKAKELNRAARLAVIEYLWKIADDRRTIYELTELFRDRARLAERFDEPLLAIFEDVLKKNPDEFDLDTQERGRTGTAYCAQIFRQHNHKKALPSLKRKFDACYKARNFADCLSLADAIKNIGDEDDKKRMEEMWPLLEKMTEEEIDRWNKAWEDKRKILAEKTGRKFEDVYVARSLPRLRRKFDEYYKNGNIREILFLAEELELFGDEEDKAKIKELRPILDKMKEEENKGLIID